MLKSKNLPLYLWGEAVNRTSYVLNRSPTRRLNGMTPAEAWWVVKPKSLTLKIFGSLCYKHVSDQLRKKLGDKGIPKIQI